MKLQPVNEKDAKDLLNSPVVGKIATLSPEGGIRMTPIWVAPDNGDILMNTFEDSELVGNLKKNPKCSLLVDSSEWPYYGVHCWGNASVEGPENDAEAIGRLFAKYFGGDMEKATEYGGQLISYGKRVFVRFRPDRAVSWDFRQ
jgi:PPOX class probable F420-dependent enzyme